MWSTQHTIVTDASKERIWQIWSDVSNWNVWDHEVQWSKLDGDFAVGTTLTLQPTRGPKSTAVITQCDDLTRFTDTAKLPLARIDFIHSMSEVGGAVEVTHRVEISGPLGILFAKLIGKGIAQGLPSAMENLVELAKQAEKHG